MNTSEDPPRRSRSAGFGKRTLTLFSLFFVLLISRTSSAGVNSGTDILFRGDGGARIALLWHDGHRLVSHSFNAMAREVENIFAEIGVEACWHEGDHGLWRENEPPNAIEIHVVLLPAESAAWGYQEQVMGASVKEPIRERTVYIFFPDVLRTLGLDLNSTVLRTPRETNELAHALGRILAHEIVHAIAPSHSHREEGLMERQLTRTILLKRGLRLDPVSAKVFRAKLQN